MNRDTLCAALLITAILLLPSCATTPNSGGAMIATQYATALTIQNSDSITPEGVLRYVDTARAIIEQDLVLDPAATAAELLRLISAENLSPADRILAQALVMQVQAQFQELDLLDPATRLSLLTVLGWIEQAARMMQTP